MPATSSRPSGSVDAGRSAKRTLIVTLTLSSDLLSQFESKSASQIGSSRSKSTTSSSTPVPVTTEDSPVENASESNDTPVPGSTPSGSTPVPGDGAAKKKGVPGPKPGTKRGSGVTSDAPRARGKPGPKKKPRLDDGTIDHGENGPSNRGTTSGAFGGHKLGPKANQGAINAGLRALDRSGNPCRKWEKKGFSIKSFTGVTWGVHTWRAPKTHLVTDKEGEPSSGSQAPATDSEGKENKAQGSSVINSEKSNSGGDVAMTADGSNLASSPVPAVATPA